MVAAKREEQLSKRAERRAPADQWRQGYEDPEAISADDIILNYCCGVQCGSEDHDAVVRNYLPSCSFTGSKPGWEFKTGALGSGYYRHGSREGTLVVASPLADISKVELKLSELIRTVGDPLKATMEDEPPDGGNPAPRMKKQRRQRKKAACARQREGAAECDALEDILKRETLQMGDQSHREHGLWAIDSLNANAWPSAAGYIATTSADIVLVQEAKV